MLALRPMAGQRTLDPLMVVRIHQGQLDLQEAAPGLQVILPPWLNSRSITASISAKVNGLAKDIAMMGVDRAYESR